jgi:hypothetical protein
MVDCRGGNQTLNEQRHREVRRADMMLIFCLVAWSSWVQVVSTVAWLAQVLGGL